MNRDLAVNVVELRRVLATQRRIHRTALIDDLVVATTRVPADEAIAVDLLLESVSDGVVVDGTVNATWAGECRRCLETVTGRLCVEVREVFSSAGDSDDTYPIADDEIDLEPLVRDAVLLSLPSAPLCRDDCAGPDPDRYPATVEGADAVADPRWAALSELRFEGGQR